MNNLSRHVCEMEVNGNALKKQLEQSQDSVAVKIKEIERIASELQTERQKSLGFASAKQDSDGKLQQMLNSMKIKKIL